jgi:hypothetical protein
MAQNDQPIAERDENGKGKKDSCGEPVSPAKETLGRQDPKRYRECP